MVITLPCLTLRGGYLTTVGYLITKTTVAVWLRGLLN